MPLIYCLMVLSTICFQSDDANTPLPAREFELEYGATIQNVPEDAKVRVWFPIPKSNLPYQIIKESSARLPAPLTKSKDKKYENTIGYFETSGNSEVSFFTSYLVKREEARPGMLAEKLDKAQKEKYLAANRMVPISGEPTKLLENKKLDGPAMEIGQELYEIVEAYMSYDKSKPGYGNGDVLWACSSKTGNCTDFHSLFISLARNKNIPARFEIGFPLAKKSRGQIGGYHCWAWFYTESKGWIGVDISEADKHPKLKEYYFGHLTPNRVAFSIGRDIELVPKSDSGPLNYFVYPHVEVDGKVWPKDNIKLELSYQDIK